MYVYKFSFHFILFSFIFHTTSHLQIQYFSYETLSHTLNCNQIAGFAYVGGACVVNKRLEKVNSVAIIEDTGGFSGIIVAAHEVGHL